MTKRTLLSSLVLTAYLGLAACAGNSEDLSSTETLQDDATQEQVFDSTAQTENPEAANMVEENAVATSTKSAILKEYDYVDPNRAINTDALAKALIYFDSNKSKIKNKNYVTVIDFGAKSTKARFHIIDMKTGKVWSIHVAHGKGSDSNHDGYAEKFSNKSGSKASSLGYYLTGSTYNGSNGLSLRLDGLSSTNSNARGRAVVIHGASYVKEKSVIQGRSWGCPAVASSLKTKVINMLKNGTLIYAYAN